MDAPSNLSAILQRGAIRSPERYFQGYDHTAWNCLPNKITPSDIDVVFDFRLRCRQLFCEFSSQATLWSEKVYGQRILYQQVLNTSNNHSASVLCYHQAPTSREIDSLRDVLSFHVMRKVDGILRLYPDATKAYDGEMWADFVRAFYGLDSKWGSWWN